MNLLKVFPLFLIALTIITGLTMTKVFAVQPDPYKIICHHNPAQNVTLQFANVQSYNGHLGTPHSQETYDTDGSCENPLPSPRPSASPSASSSISPSPSPSASSSASPSTSPSASSSPSSSPSGASSSSPSASSSPSESVLPSSSSSPSASPSASVSPSPTPQGSCCSPTTDIPGPGGNSGEPAAAGGPQGEVLGISTLASTGSFAEYLKNAIMALGTALVVLSRALKNAQKKA